jgi:pyrimidine operon attenuation protein/uracil phosphoribosyltransferase
MHTLKESKNMLPEPSILIQKIATELSKEINSNTCLIGIPKGGHLIINALKEILSATKVDYGLIDASFYRDDLEISGLKVKEMTTDVMFEIKDKKVILIDDVFFTGRTTRAAINEIFDFGRPREILLYVLIDRQSEQLPIKPSYSAHQVSSETNDYINLEEENGRLVFKIRKKNE